MTPQEKKARSLERDCRNTYGENDKSSRKAIRDGKRRVNKAFRRAEHQATAANDEQQVETAILSLKRKGWRKAPDTPLGKVLHRNKITSLEQKIRDQADRDVSFLTKLELFLVSRDITGRRFEIIFRQASSVSIDKYGASLNLEAASLEILEEFLGGKGAVL